MYIMFLGFAIGISKNFSDSFHGLKTREFSRIISINNLYLGYERIQAVY